MQAFDNKRVAIWGVGVLQVDIEAIYHFDDVIAYIDDEIEEINLITVERKQIITSNDIPECNDENEIFSKFEIKNEEKLKLSLINRRNGIGPLGKEINKITIKNKMWRDFESKMSLFISSQEYSKEGNQGGIMFRYKNEFNYNYYNYISINIVHRFIIIVL